jgi:hypothetical protein
MKMKDDGRCGAHDVRCRIIAVRDEKDLSKTRKKRNYFIKSIYLIITFSYFQEYYKFT